MINKTSLTPSFKSRVLIPYTPDSNDMVSGDDKAAKSKKYSKILLPQIEKLENNNAKDSIYLQSYKDDVSNNDCLKMTVVSYKDGKYFVGSKTKFINKFINLDNMYDKIIKSFDNSKGITKEIFEKNNPFHYYLV